MRTRPDRERRVFLEDQPLTLPSPQGERGEEQRARARPLPRGGGGGGEGGFLMKRPVANAHEARSGETGFSGGSTPHPTLSPRGEVGGAKGQGPPSPRGGGGWGGGGVPPETAR